MKKNCYRRKDNRWQYSKQKNGYRYYAIANTYRELIEKIKAIKPMPIKTIKHKTRATNKEAFIQYFQSFINDYINSKDMSQKQKNEWQRTFKRDIAPYFKNILMEKITPGQIQVFINNIKEERKREIIFQRIIKVIKKAYANGIIKRDITLAIEKPKRKVFNERHPLAFEEQRNLIDAIKGTPLYEFVIYSIVVGTRREETIKFNLLTDLDEEKKTIHIKGTKTENANRKVFVSNGFIKFLKENLINGKFEKTAAYYTREIKRVFLSLNIKECLHSLRHTCSANLYFLGASDKYRQIQLGHASIVTTNDIYTNINENIPKDKLLELYGDLYPKFD